MINSANLLKESKNLSTIRDVLFEEINLCQYILVHWKRNALVIYNMNIIKNVLVRVVHMLQDFNTLMHIWARLSTESINMSKNNQTFVTNARTLINPVSGKNMFDIHQNIRMWCSYRTFYLKGHALKIGIFPGLY